MLKGVFKIGENEWSDIKEDYEFNSSISSNDLAKMWQKVKQIMLLDIQRHPSDQKIVTRNEWIVSALLSLEESPK